MKLPGAVCVSSIPIGRNSAAALGCKAATSGPEQMHDPLRNNFCLLRARASYELKIGQVKADRSLL